ncbi:helix-turn-helix domain-containing protein [uncultured Enterovirga sp.]|uniref:helix-turn-helix domain-containing protein n=1 Tax=uncultured Enterovirga sp. TaxID=2026352 RepID=UPI0035C98C58
MDTESSSSHAADQRTRWGDAVDPGMLIVPAILLRHQQRLGLTPLEMLLVLNIVAEWDEPNELPSPRPSVLAKRIGTSPRTIQRAITKLAQAGLVERRPSETCRGMTVRRFDLSGLRKRLQELSLPQARVRPDASKAA